MRTWCHYLAAVGLCVVAVMSPSCRSVFGRSWKSAKAAIRWRRSPANSRCSKCSARFIGRSAFSATPRAAMRRSPSSESKPDGATASPHGDSSGPFEMTRENACVTGSKVSTNPFPAPARADGGTVRLSERQGEYRITVFTAPVPFRAGLVDISVLVQDAVSRTPIPDAGPLRVCRSRGTNCRPRLPMPTS